jgi:hypothetical protein
MSRPLPAPAAVLVALLAAPAALGQIAVVSVRSADAFLADARYVGRVVSPSGWASVEGMLNPALKSKNWSGVDSKRPLGAYVSWPAEIRDLNTLRFPVVLFIPVADEKRFLALVGEFGVQPQPAEGGLYRLPVPGAHHYLRFAHGHAYVSDTPASLRGALPEPKSFLPAAASKHLLTATLRVTHIPKERGRLLELVRKEIERQKDAMGHDVAAQTQVGVAALAKAVDFLQTISLTLDVDARQHRLAAELRLVPRGPGPKSAQQPNPVTEFCRYLGTARSSFAELTGRAPFAASVHLPGIGGGQDDKDFRMPPLKELWPFIDPKYEPALRLLPPFLRSIRSEGIDWCLILFKPEPKKDPEFLVGLKVRDGRKLDHALRDVFKALPAEVREDYAVAWNHSRHGSARIHRFTRFAGEDLEGYLAVRDDVFFFASDSKGLKAVKDALDGYKPAKQARTPALEFHALRVTDYLDADMATSAAKAIPAEHRDKCWLRIRLDGGEDLRLRVEAGTYLLRLGVILAGEPEQPVK